MNAKINIQTNIDEFCKAMAGAAITVKEASRRMHEFVLMIKKLEETDSMFKAMMDHMRYRCMPWYKKIWYRLFDKGIDNENI